MPLCAVVNNVGFTCNVFVQGPNSQFRAFSVPSGQTVLLQAFTGRKALLAFSSVAGFLAVMRPIDVPNQGAIFPLSRTGPIPGGGVGVASYSADVDGGESTFEGAPLEQVIESAQADGGVQMEEVEIEEVGG